MFDEPQPQNQQQGGQMPPAARQEPGVGLANESSGLSEVSPSAGSSPVMPTASPEPEVEDMFESIPEPAAEPQAAPIEEAPSMAGTNRSNKAIIIGLAGFLLVALLGIGGWYFYSSMQAEIDTNVNISPRANTNTQSGVRSRNTEADANVNANANIPAQVPPNIPPPVTSGLSEQEGTVAQPEGGEAAQSGGTAIPAEEGAEPQEPAVSEPVDTDGDGISDSDEAALGTDPFKIDSDDDGIFDREEVEVYGTNPLDKDSDGDGYLDGEEIKNGYNPLGSGKLFEIPQ